MKYIVIEQGGMEIAVLFPCFWNHADMLQRFPNTAKIVSAGIIHRSDNGRLYCSGESVILKIKSRPVEDLDLILRQLDFDMI